MTRRSCAAGLHIHGVAYTTCIIMHSADETRSLARLLVTLLSLTLSHLVIVSSVLEMIDELAVCLDKSNVFA